MARARTIIELRREIDELKRALAAQAAPPAPPIPPVPPVPLAYPHIPSILMVEQFRIYRHSTFDGGKDPLAAEEWLSAIEKIFCTSLVQKIKRDMEIFEYESKFEELSRYAPHLVSTELMKAKCYERGLHPEIRQIVSSNDLTTFQAVVKKAQIVTYSGVKLINQGQRNDFGKRKLEDKNKNSRQFKKQTIVGQSSNPPSQCPKCNKFHREECLYGKYTCYKCGQPSHVVSSCPSIKKHEQEKKGKARVSALTHDEVAQNPDVNAGILSISGTPVYVLIDSGATHSFIFNACLAKINASCKKNYNVLEVSMPSG
ncbi:uncharacterized protein LOC111374805 [Olea europaea var. sylvestris]|uniref:uncharacterized protein LOC111374805 n=1 Tax=Olea europaea var. sylvestris TaxID=158386 RepID=UPI000C1CE760|nr:uncharacterized protein LOC111374805 [Olea europaea var. sylvestris]